jgi:hypothetical protein
MTSGDAPADRWDKDRVLEAIEAKTPPDGRASAQVFLDETVPADQLPDAARRLVDAAAASAKPAAAPEIGKIHRAARSFSVRAAPSVLRELSGQPGVKALLPSEIEEGVLIEPVKKTPVP